MNENTRFPMPSLTVRFRKSPYVKYQENDSSFARAIETNKAMIREVILCFERECSRRGLSVTKAVVQLRAQGFIISAAGISRYKMGKFPSANLLTLNYLAQWCGYPSFIQMLPPEMR